MHDASITFVAKYFIILPVIAILFVFWRLPRAEKLPFIELVIGGAIISVILAKIGSHLISDPRPFVQGHFTPLIKHAADNGFPSDHTLLASFLGFAIYTKRHVLGKLMLVVALLIGLSRMAAGVHHSWDILGAFVCSLIGCWLASWLLKKYFGDTKPAARQRSTR